jgi:hypothetical protein
MMFLGGSRIIQCEHKPVANVVSSLMCMYVCMYTHSSMKNDQTIKCNANIT